MISMLMRVVSVSIDRQSICSYSPNIITGRGEQVLKILSVYSASNGLVLSLFGLSSFARIVWWLAGRDELNGRVLINLYNRIS